MINKRSFFLFSSTLSWGEKGEPPFTSTYFVCYYCICSRRRCLQGGLLFFALSWEV